VSRGGGSSFSQDWLLLRVLALTLSLFTPGGAEPCMFLPYGSHMGQGAQLQPRPQAYPIF